MKKAKRKTTPKATPKAAKHPLSGWVVFDSMRRRNYEVDFVIDGVAFVTPPAEDRTFHNAIPLNGMADDGELYMLFPNRKAFDAFYEKHYQAAP